MFEKLMGKKEKKNTWIEVVDEKYLEKRESNLSKSEENRLKSLQKRVVEGEIFIMESDKS